MTRTLWAAALVGLLGGCPSDDDDTKDSDTGGETGDTGKKKKKDDKDSDTGTAPADASVRVMHLGQGVGEVDVFANDAKTASVSMLDFKEGTAALALAPGEYDFDVSATGKTASESVIDATVTLAEDTSYAAVALGFATPNASPDVLQLAAFVEDIAGTPKDMTRLHIVHAAAGVGEVDILLIGETENTVLVDDLAFAAESDDIDVAPGAIQVGIDTSEPDDLVPELTFSVADLGKGTYASVYAVNSADEGADAVVSLMAHIAGTAEPTEINPDGTE